MRCSFCGQSSVRVDAIASDSSLYYLSVWLP
jgi:hypothetical protein